MRFQDGVTIAIPNWNHELLLPRAVKSALAAVAVMRDRGQPGEVVVIDDYSRDGSVTLLRQLEARYHREGLRVFAFGANGGLPAARNQALAHARYRHVVFLDADNELVPENLPAFVDTLTQTGAAAAYGTLLIRSVTSGVAHHAFSNESVQDKLFEGNYIDAFAVFDRTQLVDHGGYEHGNKMHEDYELWMHLATAGRQVVFVPVVLGYYYVLPASMTIDHGRNQAAPALNSRLRRMFDQMDARKRLPLATRHRRYHPELGYF